MPLLYLDSCVLIYLVEGPAESARQIRARLRLDAVDGPALLFTELTRLECRVAPLRDANYVVLRAFDQLFNAPQCRYQPLERSVLELATSLRAMHGLKVPDALHLAAALTASCDQFVTGDLRLAKAAADRIEVIQI
jgi:uncharacterized protein